ncbi:MAG: hypothetical protein Q4C46_01925 [Bacillota bacterium]|nr:hypothetical protein [Bacillota bacterium]
MDKVSPINDDCGLLCGAACCTCESERGVTDKAGANDCNADFSMGLYLLPGEEKLFSGDEDWLSWGWIMAEEYEFPESWHGKVYFLQCNTAPVCDRKKRPLQCRTFPLAPHIDEDGNLLLIYHSGRLPYSCPLITERIKLNESFIKATYTAWKHLMSDPLIYDLIEMDSVFREEDGEPINIVYPTWD